LRCFDQLARPASITFAANPTSPATSRAVSSEVAVSRSVPASASWSSTVRTACPSFDPASHNGYQIADANASTRRAVDAWTNSRSRSLNGASSPRP
jgi:hypothetical protein